MTRFAFGAFQRGFRPTDPVIEPPVDPGAREFILTSPNVPTDWVVPDGVFFISAAVIGGGAGGGRTAFTTNRGGGGGGGGLTWRNNIPVTPGETLVLTVGSGGRPSQSTSTAGDGFAGNETKISRGGVNILTAGGGNGGRGPFTNTSGAGGTGGGGGTGANYLGDGGSFGARANDGSSGASGGYGGGAGDYDGTPWGLRQGNDVFGQSDVAGNYGRGGNGGNSTQAGTAGTNGRLRIIWGDDRSFPNNAASLTS